MADEGGRALRRPGRGCRKANGGIASAGTGAAHTPTSFVGDIPFFAEGGDALPGIQFYFRASGAGRADLGRAGGAHITPLGVDRGVAIPTTITTCAARW
jgi:hypothetical protein